MINVILSGCNGRMGDVLSLLCAEHPDITVVAGFDVNTAAPFGYPVFSSPDDFSGEADVIIDFSNVLALPALFGYALRTKTPVVLATTGLDDKLNAMVNKASESIAIFKSANMSLGINVLCELVRQATAIFGDAYDIEIIEKHHNKKLDAPSGTALMLADAASSALPYKAEYTYDRSRERKMRSKQEIGISAIRGGTIVGQHDVLFAGHNEVVTLSHEAQSREVFAAGAVKAALFLAGQAPGLYAMSDLVAKYL